MRRKSEKVALACTHCCVRQTASGELLCHTGSSARCSVMTRGGGVGRGTQEGGGLSVTMADAHCRMAETNTILQLKNFKKWLHGS